MIILGLWADASHGNTSLTSNIVHHIIVGSKSITYFIFKNVDLENLPCHRTNCEGQFGNPKSTFAIGQLQGTRR